ncbi:Ca2+-dependent phosphoinositide-specific phospholipase C [Persicitalea jodogahamensis]|uniref:PLC-like phosphodiesterase n=1 Tax=Persicitalea jodogahamensis TaxID=402147 RepID=A0A8J3G8E1_9BACT|nr:Ca2+-dependent phosphoinositide-specific phospholipase C [Persicitalea jodogahamensis]GHB58215.1 hypothetical protein GCM10007390_09620 [Persicitalea jodogahamensis]
MENYQQLHYNEAAFKSSHNSYDRKESLDQQLQFYDTPDAYYNCGCRAVELDIWRHSKPDEPNSPDWFTVNHLTNGGKTLDYYLSQLRVWHEHNPGHDVIGVSLDIKSSGGDASTFPEEIDRYLTNFMGRDLILTPGDLFSGINGNNLSELVKAQGWPTLSAMTNKFIFCLSGNEDWKKLYSEMSPATRFCFSDATDASQLMVPNSRVVYNIKEGKGSSGEIDKLRSDKILIRVYDVDNGNDWQSARKLGANNLATNKVSGSTWASVSTHAPYSPFESN